MSTLTLTPPTGPAGSTIRATGTGFKPKQVLRLYIGHTIVTEALCDDAGNFRKDFTLPFGSTGELIVRVAVATSTAAKFTVEQAPPPPPPPSGDWLSRIGNPPAAVTGPKNKPDVKSSYSAAALSVQEMFEYGWQAGFRTAEDLQILAAIGQAESGGHVGTRNWHPEFGFKVVGEPEHLMFVEPAGVRDNGLLMRSDRGVWQISDHWYPGCYDNECDDPATAAKMVKWIRDNRGGWEQWDTFRDGSYKNKVPLAAAQAFVASKQ